MNFCYIFKKIALLSITALSLSSCAREISSDLYTARQVGEASITYPGVIKNVREVCMQEGERLQDNGLGIVGGGVAGGVIGSAVGKGNLLPTALGALAGAVTGSVVEKKLKQQTALEYVVELDNGQLLTIVQGRDHLFNVGQPVYVITCQTGRSRITPR